MPKPLLVALLIASMAAAAGCGDEGASSSAAVTAEGLLLGPRDLPGGTVAKSAPPELCGPLPILQREGGQTAISPMLFVKGTRVVEAVGVFGSPATASLAYMDLNDSERLDCIRTAIGAYDASQGTVEDLPAQPLDFGDEGSLVRYLVIGADSKPQSYADVVSIRAGRCAAALLVAAESGDPPPSGGISEQASREAARLLANACE